MGILIPCTSINNFNSVQYTLILYILHCQQLGVITIVLAIISAIFLAIILAIVLAIILAIFLAIIVRHLANDVNNARCRNIRSCLALYSLITEVVLQQQKQFASLALYSCRKRRLPIGTRRGRG